MAASNAVGDLSAVEFDVEQFDGTGETNRMAALHHPDKNQ